MMIRIPTKPIKDMSVRELFAEFTMVPLYNFKTQPRWNEQGTWEGWYDWRGEKRHGNVYYFACVFHSEAEKFDPDIEDIIAMDERNAKWLIDQMNLKREAKKSLRETAPKYLREMWAEELPPVDLMPMPMLSEYDRSTAQIEFTPENHRNMNEFTTEIYEFALYFGFRFGWRRSIALHKIVYKIMMYPRGYRFGDKEVEEIIAWWEDNDGAEIQKINSMLKNHPKRKEFWYLTKKIKEKLARSA